MPPTQSTLPLPNQSDENFVHVISDLLTSSECEDLINSHTTDLVRINANYTRRLREVYDDEAFAELLWERLAPFYGTMKVVDEDNQVWTASHLNPRFRFCKYLPGDAFGAHFDSRHLASANSQSFLTVNMYLNDVPESAGGATRALDPSMPGERDGDKYKVIAKMQPSLGSAAIFRDHLYHDGEPLKDGLKYLLRTDVMFERDTPFDFERIYSGLDHDQKGRKALDYAKRFEDSGDTDEAVFWYRKAFRMCPELEREA